LFCGCSAAALGGDLRFNGKKTTNADLNGPELAPNIYLNKLNVACTLVSPVFVYFFQLWPGARNERKNKIVAFFERFVADMAL